jgi:hypothetical protein
MFNVSFRDAGASPDPDYGNLMRLDIQYEFFPKSFFCPKWDYIACNRAPDDPRRRELDPNDQEAKAKERFIAMLADDRYREAYAALVQTTLDNYLVAVEHELEFWHRNGRDLSARIKSDENVIFSLLAEFGPEVLGYPSVQDKIREWCGENCVDKFRLVKKALDIYKKEVMHERGFLQLNLKKYIVSLYPDLKNSIKSLKREIREHDRRAPRSQVAAKEIIRRWKKKGNVRFFKERYRWFDELAKKAESRGARSAGDILNDVFSGERFPREITKMVLGDMIHRSPAVVDRILRDERRIRKSVYNTSTRIEHRF